MIVTVSNEEIIDDWAIKAVLTYLHKSQTYIHIEFTDLDMFATRRVDKGRVINVSETTFDLWAFYGSSTAKYRNIPFSNIVTIRVIASKQDISSKHKVTRWHLLDVAEIE